MNDLKSSVSNSGNNVFKTRRHSDQIQSSSSTKTNVNVPDGLEEFLVAFTVSILKDKPINLYEYSLNYFAVLNEKFKNEQDNISQMQELMSNDDDTAMFGSPNSNHFQCSITITTEPEALESMPDSMLADNMAAVTTKLSAGKNFLDENDDEILADDIGSEYCKKRAYSNSRRFSVFSKSYDPEAINDSDRHDDHDHVKSKQHTFSVSSAKSNEHDQHSFDVNDATCNKGDDADTVSNQLDAINLGRLNLVETDYKIILNSGNEKEEEISNSNDASQDSDGTETEDNKDIELLQNRFYEHQVDIKSEEKRIELKKILLSIVLFQHMYDEDIEHLIDSMFERKSYKNEVIIREGDNGHYFYVIMKGVFEIYIQDRHRLKHDHQMSLKERNALKSSESEQTKDPGVERNKYGRKIGESKSFFGELALLYNQPRSATIISRQDNGILYCMNRDKFQRLVIASAFKRRKMYEDFLNSVPLLRESMNDSEISSVADALKSQTYAPGQCIFKQKDKPNGMYFIESGSVKVVQETNNDQDSGELISKLSVGDFFGEIALVNKAARSASVYADDYNDLDNNREPCKLAFLDLDAFERLMGPCIERLKSKIVTYKNL